MPPKPTNPTTTPTNQTLNEREQRILINAIFLCAKSPVEIDYPKLAIVLGLKDRNSSKAAWHGVKKKIGAFAVGMKGDDPEDGDHDDKNRPDTGEGDGGDEFVPVKKGKEKKTEESKTGKAQKAERKRKAVETEVYDDDAGEGVAKAPEKKAKKTKKGKKSVDEVKGEVSDAEA